MKLFTTMTAAIVTLCSMTFVHAGVIDFGNPSVSFSASSTGDPDVVFDDDNGGQTTVVSIPPTDQTPYGYLGLKHRGESALALDRQAQYAIVRSVAYLPFDVGDLPVRLNSLYRNTDAKWVNGGGTSSTPSTQWYMSATIREQIGLGYSDTDPILWIVSMNTFSSPLVGNGLRLLTDYVGTPNGQVAILAAQRSYYLSVKTTTYIDATSFGAMGDPSITVSNEFGGSLSGGTFSGFEGSFSYNAVPEPATSCLVALGGLSILARRRLRF